MTLVLEILIAITDVHHQTGLLLAYTYAGSADEDGGGPQCVLTFGFEHGMETKVHAQCARRDNSMHAVETP